ncbi:MAG: tyrosine-type recombinase/integrase [Chloroflexi bacterium]|nr:tyrosine-type recombinase/integrase [Chloroflexota bacterium]
MPKRSKLVATDPTKNVLEWEECQRIEAAATNQRDRCLVRVLYRTACRVSEALALTPDDVLPRRQGIMVNHLKQRLLLKCPSCAHRLARDTKFCPGCGDGISLAQRELQEEHSRRLVPVDAETIRLLRKYARVKAPRPGDHRLFPITRQRARQVIQECARRAGLDMTVMLRTDREHLLSPHRLRDAFATHTLARSAEMGLDATESLRMLQEVVGHRSAATTMKYLKVGAKEVKSWYEKVTE